MRAAATITRCCATACRSCATASPRETGGFGYRVFTDSAPVMEVELAARAGIGWRGKHTLLLSRDAGSWFFLGEIYCDIPLPTDEQARSSLRHLSNAASTSVPTQAIRGPYQLDARRCISYLTIEHKSAIPEELRPLIGNRVYGCDDCQLVCPWNRFRPAHGGKGLPTPKRPGPRDAGRALRLDAKRNSTQRLQGSPIRRIGYERWLRNLAVGLGNAPTSLPVVVALRCPGGPSLRASQGACPLGTLSP